ncbi:MAG: sodium-translocating pyrophosphatase, partial [Clostridiaceae bacterium]|nr:sodium-translocating pyrophosphatase [Clostridiaceae bacterium]
MKGFLVIAIAAVALSLAFAAYNYLAVRRRSRGTDRMGELSDIIADGARTFIKSEYRIIAIAAAGITVLLSLMIEWYVGIAFLTGTIMSATAGYIGMRIATIANVRVANEARVSKS